MFYQTFLISNRSYISASVSRFGYAGEWVDPSTGYSYNKARWYDISTGVFLSEDPLVQLTQNAFGYTEGNPITQIDPLGLFSFSSAWDWTMRNSAFVSTGLLLIGTAATFTGFGAPVGLAVAAAGSALSVASANYNFKKGNKFDGTVDLISVIPGAGIIKIATNVKNLKSL